MGHPHNGHRRELPAEQPVVPAEPRPLAKFLAYVIAGLILVGCVGCLVGVVVRVVQWAWPG